MQKVGRRGATRVALGVAGVALAACAWAPAASAATFTVTTTADAGAGSLRQAITDANAGTGGDTIAFAIPGAGPQVIRPASALPAIAADDTTIDGCTQPGADCSQLPLRLQVQVDGQGLAIRGYGVTIQGLSLTGSTSTVAAIELQRAGRSGVFVYPDDLTVVHNYIGLAPDGSAAGNAAAVRGSLPGNGRANAAAIDRLHVFENVISGNSSAAIDLTERSFAAVAPLTGTRIRGNVIGLDPTGTQPRPNGGDGVDIDVAGDTQVTGNTIASNTGVGIRYRGRAQAVPGSDPSLDPGLLIQGNVVRDNRAGGIAVGPLPTSWSPFPDAYSGPVAVFGNEVTDNGGAGVLVTGAASTIRPNARIGGIGAGEGNTISGNAGAGVQIGADASDTSVAVTVRGNAIFGNTGPAIDLGGDGPTANGDAGVVRSGPNLLTNAPAILRLAHGSVIVDGTYAGAANATYTLDFYARVRTGDAQTRLGSTSVTTGAAGTAVYSVEFPVALPEGALVEATATDADGNTSEFSPSVAMPAVPDPPDEPSGGGETSTPPPADGGTPPTTPPAGGQSPAPSATGQQPTPRPPAGGGSGGKAARGTPRLRLSQTVSRPRVRAGQTVTFTITLANSGRGAARDVHVCSDLPAGLAFVSARPTGTLSQGRRCWTVRTLGAGKRATFTVRARVLNGAGGVRGVRASATARGTRTTTAERAVRVIAVETRGGGVTG